MSIEYRKGDLLQSGAAALVNPVNTAGISGKGLALAFKRWAPDAQARYESECREHMLRAGDVFCCRTSAPVKRGEYATEPMLYYACTKERWQKPSRLEWVERCCDKLVYYVAHDKPKSIAICALGCGLGSLAWSDVRPLIHAAAERMSARGVDVYIYEPQ